MGCFRGLLFPWVEGNDDERGERVGCRVLIILGMIWNVFGMKGLPVVELNCCFVVSLCWLN